MCNQLNHYVSGLVGEQVNVRPFLTEELLEEFEGAKKAISKNILLTSFSVKRKLFVIMDASALNSLISLSRRRRREMAT